MNFDEYAKAAARTSSPFSDIVNGALGLAGEAGEVAELVKKHKYHGQDIDLDALAKEMGDVLWYLAEICNQSGLSLDAIASGNIAKLRERHPGAFDPSYHDAPAPCLTASGGEYDPTDDYGERSVAPADVLAGYEWALDTVADAWHFWAPGERKTDGFYAAVWNDMRMWGAFASSGIDETAFDSGPGVGAEGKRRAEAALRAHLEGKQCS